jgi:pre-mRNA-splicing factor RBM22/SLT11
MLDLKYNLPVQVRDTLISRDDETFSQENMMPESKVGREFALKEAQKNDTLQNIMSEKYLSHDLLNNLKKIEPHYQRNHARICSFYTKGCCNRGLQCPFRHTVPILSSMPKQNYHDRYNGINDPVAHKILSRVANMSRLCPPDDETNTTIFIGNITSRITPQLLKEKLYSYGEIQTIRILYRRNCAFVTFCSRSEAEQAVLCMSSQVDINGHSLAIRWSKISSRKENSSQSR